MRPRTAAAVLVLAAAAAVCPSAARAEDPAALDRAKMLYNAGAQAYGAGQFADASQAFEEAYKLTPRIFIQFARAQAVRKLYFMTFQPADLRRAVKYYKDYLADGTGEKSAEARNALAELGPRLVELDAKEAQGATPPPPPPPPEQKTRLMVSTQISRVLVSFDGAPPLPSISAEVTPGKHHVKVTAEGYFDEERDAEAIEQSAVPIPITMRERPGLLAVDAPPGADVQVDGRLVGTTPFAAPVEVAAGPHFVAVVKNGRKAFTKDVVLERGKTTTLSPTLDSSGQRTAAYVFFGAAGAGLLAGGAFTVVSFVEQGRAQKVLDQKTQGNIQPADLDTYNSAIDLRDKWKTAAIVTFGASAAVLATGLVLFAFDKPQVTAQAPTEPAPKKDQPARPLDVMGVAPIMGPGFYGVALTGRM